MADAKNATVERSVEGNRTRLSIRGRLDRESAPVVLDWFRTWLPKGKDVVSLDLGEVAYLDSAGVAVLAESLKIARERGCALDLVKVSEAARSTMEMFRFHGEAAEAGKARPGIIEELGDQTIRSLSSFKRMLLLMADTFSWALAGPFAPVRGAPQGEFLRQSILLGSRAFGIVSLLSFLIGLTLALLSAQQLRQFGANIYVANLLAIAMTREMGPLVTAVIVAGRSGSAIAAEIATMKVTEEVDALEAMGFSPVRFLVVPKFYAVTITQPMLTLVADAFGILGGMVVASMALAVPMPAFLRQAGDALVLKDLISGLAKSVVFGWVILMVGAYSGMETHGGAQGVGLSTTRSVVLSIFLVIITDCIFSLVFYM